MASDDEELIAMMDTALGEAEITFALDADPGAEGHASFGMFHS
jgi:hypothetical protein